MHHYTGSTIPEPVLRQILRETIAFEIPLKQISERISTLELFHGPTLAFKDIGARFMSRCLGYFMKEENVRLPCWWRHPVIPEEQSNGFSVEGVDVGILYPSERMPQELQPPHLKNIRTLEVKGSFDDCQALVNRLF